MAMATMVELRNMREGLKQRMAGGGTLPEADQFHDWVRENFEKPTGEDSDLDTWTHLYGYTKNSDPLEFRVISRGPDGQPDINYGAETIDDNLIEDDIYLDWRRRQ